LEEFKLNKLRLDSMQYTQLDTFYWLIELIMGLWNKKNVKL
jgi:hypothetical protein